MVTSGQILKTMLRGGEGSHTPTLQPVCPARLSPICQVWSEPQGNI